MKFTDQQLLEELAAASYTITWGSPTEKGRRVDPKLEQYLLESIKPSTTLDREMVIPREGYRFTQFNGGFRQAPAEIDKHGLTAPGLCGGWFTIRVEYPGGRDVHEAIIQRNKENRDQKERAWLAK